MNELDIAKQIAAGEIESPQKCENMWLFALRITGTGVAYRDKLDEYVYRPPEEYLNPKFMERCAGLPVIWFHPDNKTELLSSEEYGKRNIGSIMFAYKLGNEVWGIARIYDETAAKEMQETQLSTSPGVILSDSSLNKIKNNDRLDKILIEGEASHIDHLAICLHGVWDKGGEPLGVSTQKTVRTDSMDKIPEETAPEMSAGEKAILGMMEQIMTRLTALESAEKKEASGHEEAAESLGDPEKAIDNAEDMERNKAQIDDDDCHSDDSKTKFADDDDDEKSDKEKKEEEAKIVADSLAKENKLLKSKIAAIEARLPVILNDAELNQLSEAQARADSVAHAFGTKAPAPMMGERPLSYRKRVVEMFKKHSNDWKGIDLGKIMDEATFGIAERAIYADATAVAQNPAYYEGDGLIENVQKLRGGGEISTFKGSPSAWMNQFKAPSHKVSFARINK